MKNPYKGQHDDLEIRLGKAGAWILVFLFLLIISLPPLYRNILELTKGGDLPERWVPATELFKIGNDTGLLAHLEEFEDKLEKAQFTDPPRRLIQRSLVESPLREGNRKTRIGKEGWLYLQTGLDSITGYGPLKPEPDSVAKDPRRSPWRAPLDVIRTFAGQLDEFGVELILVPIPVKPMIYPEHLGHAAPLPVTHPDAAAFYSKINALPNVEVIDLSEDFWKLKDTTRVFLKQDTHWTPAGMEHAAEKISSRISAKPWYTPGPGFTPAAREKRQSPGDLVEKLDMGQTGFAEETVEVMPVMGQVRDQDSPIVLLGDSFTNIYADAIGLSWGQAAGFAEHLALRLRIPIDVIAINGGAATEVRQALAQRKGSVTIMEKKKVVVWAIAARDLLLAESGAREAEIEWQDVSFNDEPPAPGHRETAKIRATMLTRPELPDPQSTTYSTLLYAAEYHIDAVLEGDIKAEEAGRILVLHYAFKDRQPLESSTYRVGDQREFELVSFASRKELRSLETRNDSDLFDLYWDLTGIRPLNATIAGKPHVFASLGCCLFALLLGLGLRRAARQ
jgi:hypothetical protein